MPPLEVSLYGMLVGDETFAGLVATHGDRPALFEQQAPADTDRGWGATQYPRVSYSVVREADAERRIDGLVILGVWSLSEGTQPEDVGNRILELLDGAVLGDDEMPVGLQWQSSKLLIAERTLPGQGTGQRAGQDEQVLGLEIELGIVGLPIQRTEDPDPLEALSEWTAEQFPDVQVDPESWTPASGSQAVWWRLAGIQALDRTAAVAWMQGAISAHVLAAQPTDRLPLVRALTERIAVARRLLLPDGSPLDVLRIAADSEADPLRRGQIRIECRYGVLVDRPKAPRLQTAELTGDATGQVV